MPEPNNPEALLPQALVAQHLAQLHEIADALSPTDALRLIVGSGTALRYPKLMQYACGTEHLALAIAYLERAIGVNGTEANTNQHNVELPVVGRGIRHVEVQWERSATTDETLPDA